MVKLPVKFNPSRLQAENKAYFTEIPVAQFKRFQQGLVNSDGSVCVEMAFTMDDHARVGVEGRFTASCHALCQRCLNRFDLKMDGEFKLTFVADEASAERLPDDLDPVIVGENGQIHAVDMLEDELILQMPVAPRHAELSDCIENGYTGGQLEHEELPAEASSAQINHDRKNPFDVLKNFTKSD